jgi:hypothetical protein
MLTRKISAWSTRILASSLLLSACGWLRSTEDAARADAELDDALAKRALLLADTEAPLLFLTSDHDAPAFGFANAEAKLVARPDPVENGRIAVRILGRLHVEGYVPDGSVELYVQKTSLLAGSAVVLRAGDRVGLVGPRNDAVEHEVLVRVPVGGTVLGPYRGRVPADLLAATRPKEPQVLTGGTTYQLPAGAALPIFSESRGQLVTLVPPLKRDLTLAVVGGEEDWPRVRVGSGPCLEGFTNVPLRLLGQVARPAPASRAPRVLPSRGQVPWRIARTPGPLLLVSAGTQLRFRGRIVATFRAEGWARALSSLDQAEVELLAAVDDHVTVRGVAPTRSITQVEESVFQLAPPAGPNDAAELASAR